VIQNTLTALARINTPIRVVVLAGEPPSATMPIDNAAVVEALGYNTSTALSPDAVLADLEAASQRALGGPADVWHIHNHALGKNVITPAVVARMARKGYRLLLHIHDFAEDGRPANYQLLKEHLGEAKQLGATLYPQGSHVHYALLNQRDLRFLRAAGGQDAQLHYLPNAVDVSPSEEMPPPTDAAASGQVFVYPVRAIRRKNLGEFLLWAALAHPDDVFAVTRAPRNPTARPVYEQWVAFAESLGLPVRFGVGDQTSADFATLVKGARAFVTTSVAEGFGLIFLEPWLLNRPLFGRKLPEITDEFERAGMNLSTMYDRLYVPLTSHDRDQFRQEVQTQLTHMYAAYNRTVRAAEIERAVVAAISENRVDFGRLNELLQQAVIERIVRDPALKSAIVPAELAVTTLEPDVIQQNSNIVRTQFNLDQYGERLRRIYRAVAASPVEPGAPLDAQKLLDQFLIPERLSLLRTS